jgi:hypothetical protein
LTQEGVLSVRYFTSNHNAHQSTASCLLLYGGSPIFLILSLLAYFRSPAANMFRGYCATSPKRACNGTRTGSGLPSQIACERPGSSHCRSRESIRFSISAAPVRMTKISVPSENIKYLGLFHGSPMADPSFVQTECQRHSILQTRFGRNSG